MKPIEQPVSVGPALVAGPPSLVIPACRPAFAKPTARQASGSPTFHCIVSAETPKPRPPHGRSSVQVQFPDLAHPIYGPQELAGDFWASYRRKIFKGIDWRLQLNVRNAWGNGKDIPVTANPDGSIAVIRIPNETRWYLSSSFSF